MTIAELIFTHQFDSSFNISIEIATEHTLKPPDWTMMGQFGSPFNFYQAKLQAFTFDSLIDLLIKHVNAVPDECIIDRRQFPMFILMKKWSMTTGNFGQYKLLWSVNRVICDCDQKIVTLTNQEICVISSGYRVLTLTEVLSQLKNLCEQENSHFREHYEEMISFVLSTV